MRKLFVLFLAVSALTFLALPVMATHGGTHTEPTGAGAPPTNVPDTGADLVSVIDTVTNWIFAVLTILALIYVLLAAFQFVTAGGDAVKVGEARMKLIWAAVGIIIALASKGLVPIIRNIVGI